LPLGVFLTSSELAEKLTWNRWKAQTCFVVFDDFTNRVKRGR